MTRRQRDHGGGLDAAIARFGGERADWLDLSTGINPAAYPLPDFPAHCWTDLPDANAQSRLLTAARAFWCVPDGAQILAAAGVSALITRLPNLHDHGRFAIVNPTYNEHEAAFLAHGWQRGADADARVFVHPNNPDGRLFSRAEILAGHKILTIIDESFCDTCPDRSHMDLALTPGVILLKGLGKFWGLAGVRLGFAIGLPDTLAKLSEMLGPWPVSGPALHLGALALSDSAWAAKMRQTLHKDAARLDRLMIRHSRTAAKGTDLFRLYEVADAKVFQNNLAQNRIWSRIFPYSHHFLRLGLPSTESGWNRLTSVLEGL